MSRVLVLAGGSPHAHDYHSIGVALGELAASVGPGIDDVAVVDHPDIAARRLCSAEPWIDALIVDGLWWRMLGAEYDAWRDSHAYTTSAATREALARFVHHGGGLVAIHTAPICFDDWPEWGDIVGASWRWGVSSHPLYGPVTASVVGEHPVVAGLPATMVLDDEVYGDLDVRAHVEVLATAQRHPGDADQPVVWAHRYGAGKVVFDGFGHDAASIRHPINAQVLRQALTWVMDGAA